MRFVVFGLLVVMLLASSFLEAQSFGEGQIVILNSYPGNRTILYRSPDAFWECKQEIEEFGRAGAKCLAAILTWTQNGEKARVLEDEASYSGMIRVEILTGPQAGYRGWVIYTFLQEE